MNGRLLAGPALAAGAETYREHVDRLGPLPEDAAARGLIATLEASGLLGRGGAGFPVGRKWRSVADRSSGDSVVLVNGAEGEPLSAKDRALMTLRPHLVIDGAILAADAVGAGEIILYVGGAHVAARDSIRRALGERASSLPHRVRLVEAPARYVAGEESAAIQFVDAGRALPTALGPRPYEVGVGGRPTLVQNIESLSHAALIARFGDAWYRSAGRDRTPGTTLITLSGPMLAPSVLEVDLGTPIGEVAGIVGSMLADTQAVMLGGYFGGWVGADAAWGLPLDPVTLRERGLGIGCGVVSFLPVGSCGVAATASIIEYMAGQSAAQCGPCVFGLRAIADATRRIADAPTGGPGGDDLARIRRWAAQLVGRGACRHPDGAVGLVQGALRVFEEEFVAHERLRRCPARSRAPQWRVA